MSNATVMQINRAKWLSLGGFFNPKLYRQILNGEYMYWDYTSNEQQRQQPEYKREPRGEYRWRSLLNNS